MNGPETVPDRDYTTQQAADLCGMSINTLLSWERRYGVPNPRRNPRGERIFSAEDIVQVRWLQAETARGVPIREASTRLRDGAPHGASDAPVEDVVVAVNASPSPAVQSGAPSDTLSRRQREVIAAVERYDRAGLAVLLSRFALESDPVTVTETVVFPVITALRARAEAGEDDFLILANHWLASRLSHWMDVLNPARQATTPTAILVPEDDALGPTAALAHGLQLARRGTHVIDLPAGAALETIVAVTRAVAPAGSTSVILFSGSHRGRHCAETRADLLRDLLPASVAVTIVAPGDAPAPSHSAIEEVPAIRRSPRTESPPTAIRPCRPCPLNPIWPILAAANSQDAAPSRRPTPTRCP